jgi:hypothetical protein
MRRLRSAKGGFERAERPSIEGQRVEEARDALRVYSELHTASSAKYGEIWRKQRPVSLSMHAQSTKEGL